MNCDTGIHRLAKRCRHIATRAGLVMAVALAFLLGYVTNSRISAVPAAETSTSAGGEEKADTRMYTCSMHPQIRRRGPGKCPICGMDLVPVTAEYKQEEGSSRRYVTSDSARALMQVETSSVDRRPVSREIRMVGKVEYDETTLGHISAWVPGRLDRLYVDYTGVEVTKGDPMAEIYSPDLITAQEELLQAIDAVRALENSDVEIVKESTRRMVEDARAKLRLWGLSPEQVEEIEKRRTPSDHVTLNAPTSGVVVHKSGQEGMYVKTGTHIYTIARLDEVWVKLDAYESDLAWLREGQEVVFSAKPYPGEVFKGRISFIDPILDDKTRTVKVRVNVPNPDRKLKPGIFVNGLVKAQATDPKNGNPLVIPVTAALVTGRRAIVYVEVPDSERPTFEGREIVLGPRAGDYYIVRNGLEEGEIVVINGAFKIDSALQIQAKPSMMTPEGGGAAAVHMHGGMPAREATDKGMTHLEVPPEFVAQIDILEASYANVADAVNSGETEQARGAFAKFGQALDNAAGSLLEGHAKMAWTEISMLLKNDAVEGTHAETPDDAGRVLAGLTRNVKRLRAELGSGHAGTQKAQERVSIEFATGLRLLLGDYFELHSRLAEDDMPGATSAAKRAAESLGKIDMSGLVGEQHVAWMAFRKQILDSLESIIAGTDMASVRQGFEDLSNGIQGTLKAFPGIADGPVYVLRCPMASGGRGANWLQTDPQVRNPYFGASMLTCGGVLETIPAEQPAPEGGHLHE